ncbi:MAG TPA: manganese efflux pump MntP family protein [Lachnospiraceae bacterium]
MGIVELFLLALALSMDAFAVSVCKGLSIQGGGYKEMIIAGSWFGGFQALMPTIGFFFGGLFYQVIAKYDHWVAFLLLVVIGGNMVKEFFERDVCPNYSMGVKDMFLMALATSIDALAVGVTFAFLKVSILPAAVCIGLTTFVCSAAGIRVGSVFGTKYKAKAELCGGLVLILIGIKILLDGLLG